MTLIDDNAIVATRAYVKAKWANCRNGLNALYLPYYDALQARLQQDEAGWYFAPYSAGRSLEDQQALYNHGRTDSQPLVTNAQAGDSAHNWGCATDFAEFRAGFTGQDIWDKANWDYYAQAVRDVGLAWGGDFPKFADKPHNQLYLDTSWKSVGDVYRANGSDAAQAFITSNLHKGV